MLERWLDHRGASEEESISEYQRIAEEIRKYRELADLVSDGEKTNPQRRQQRCSSLYDTSHRKRNRFHG